MAEAASSLGGGAGAVPLGWAAAKRTGEAGTSAGALGSTAGRACPGLAASLGTYSHVPKFCPKNVNGDICATSKDHTLKNGIFTPLPLDSPYC